MHPYSVTNIINYYLVSSLIHNLSLLDDSLTFHSIISIHKFECSFIGFIHGVFIKFIYISRPLLRYNLVSIDILIVIHYHY